MQGKITRNDGSEVVINKGDTVVILKTNDNTDDVNCAAEGTVWDMAGMIAGFLADEKDIRDAVIMQLAGQLVSK